jgi:hypothetical protein
MSFSISDSAPSNVPLSPEEQTALDNFLARCSGVTSPETIAAEVATLPAEAQNFFWSAVQQWGILVTEIQCLLAATEWLRPSEARAADAESVPAGAEELDE